MSDTSVIPTPASPDVCSVSVLIDGTEISGEFDVLSASVSNELNRIPAASVQLRDGEASKQTFEASDTDHFVPGKEIEIKLGYRGETETVFKGIIVKHRVRVRKQRHAAVAGVPRQGGAHDQRPEEPLLHRHDRRRHPRRAARRVRPRPRRGVHQAVAQGGRPVRLDRLGLRRVPGRGQRARRRRPRRQGHRRPAGDRRRAGRHRPVRGDRARARRRDRRPLAGQGRHRQGLERHRPGARLGRCLRAVGDRQRQPVGVGPVRRDRRRPAPAPPRRQARRARAAGVGRRAAAEGPARQGPRPGALPGVRRRHRGRCRRGRPASASASPASSTWPACATRSPTATGRPTSPSDSPRRPTPPPTRSAPSRRADCCRPSTDCRSASSRRSRTTPTARTGSRSGFRSSATPRRASGPGSPRSTPATSAARSSAPRSTTRWSSASSTATRASRWCSASATAAPSRLPRPATDDNHVKGYVSRSKLKLTFDDDKKIVILETPGGNKLTLSDDEKTASLVDQNGNKVTLDDGGITLESAKDLTLKASGDVKLEGTNVELQVAGELQGRGAGRRRRQVQRDPDHQGLAGPDQLRRRTCSPPRA